jgi:hypothetical protein
MLPLRIVVPAVPVLVMAVPPSSVKLPAESRMLWPSPETGKLSIAASAKRGKGSNKRWCFIRARGYRPHSNAVWGLTRTRAGSSTSRLQRS